MRVFKGFYWLSKIILLLKGKINLTQPQYGETVVVQKPFYYDGSFRKSINPEDPGQKPNWFKVEVGTELKVVGTILVTEFNPEEELKNIKIRFSFIDNPNRSIVLDFIESHSYWRKKSEIRDQILSKIGI